MITCTQLFLLHVVLDLRDVLAVGAPVLLHQLQDLLVDFLVRRVATLALIVLEKVLERDIAADRLEAQRGVELFQRSELRIVFHSVAQSN